MDASTVSTKKFTDKEEKLLKEAAVSYSNLADVMEGTAFMVVFNAAEQNDKTQDPFIA